MEEGLSEREIIVALLGIGALLFGTWNRRRLRALPAWRVLWAGFCVLLSGWILTVLEEVLWSNALNVLEHACYAASSVLMAVWCWLAFARPQKGGEHVGRGA